MNSNKKPLKNNNNSIFFAASITILIILAFSLISGTLPLPNYAYAHSLPVTETPAPNSIIKKGEPSPSKIIIDFSERPDPKVSTMQVLNSKNQRVDNNDFTIVGDHDREAMTTLNTHKLTDGVYTVSWMTQSADDGHIARGSYVFGIGNVGPSSSTGSAASSIN
jgi:methionine-rich copper-binding protein CopC